MHNKHGFTLMEVMLATAIMVSVLGALTYVLSQCNNLTEIAANQDIALNAAQEKLEEIANSDLTKIIDYNGQTFDVTGLTGPPNPQDIQETLPAGSVSVASASGTVSLYNVTVTVTWQQSGGRQISRSLSTVLVKKD